jgi:hypothetical protein
LPRAAWTAIFLHSLGDKFVPQCPTFSVETTLKTFCLGWLELQSSHS